MKKLRYIFLLMLCGFGISFAQAPQSFGYQIVVTDAQNNILANDTFSVRVSIIQNFATGATVYKELHQTTTNASGLMSLEIGKGSIISGDFSKILWLDYKQFLKIEIAPIGTTSYTALPTIQLKSVPYAITAAKTRKAPRVQTTINTCNANINHIDTLVASLGHRLKTLDSLVLLQLYDTINDNTNGIGIFSVTDSSYVTFAPGNLQFQKSDSSWFFASNQYEFIDTQYNIRYNDTNYSGKLDYISWGASGYNGINPCDTTLYPGNYYGSGFNDLNGTNYDWGYYNSISYRNQDIQSQVWRTPKQSEWEYIFNQRTNAHQLYSLATVNNVHGIVILPDDWDSIPFGCSFVPIAQNYTTNVYDGIFWTAMESKGAVFLPASGYYCHHHREIHDFSMMGFYWTDTHDSNTDTNAHYIYFGYEYQMSLGVMGSSVVTNISDERTYKHSIRLVKTVVRHPD